jgi:diguanylate cyclase (GGDEF)-like protein/PAS domain S-box-containing protein
VITETDPAAPQDFSAGDQRLVPGRPIGERTSLANHLQGGGQSIAPWVYLGINVPLVAAIFWLPQFHVYLWGLLGLGSAAAMVVGIIRNKPRRRAAWVVLALGVTTFSLGDITYDVLTKFMHEVNPFPSISDVFYLATYPLLAAGLILMVRSHRQRDEGAGALLDALIITSGLGALSWIYLIQPYVHALDMTVLSKLISIAYPLGDILLLCVLVRLVFDGGTRSASVRLLAVGACGVLIADCVYGWIQLHGSWKVGGPTDLGWVLFYVCWGAAALHPAMRDLTVERAWRPRQLNVVSLALLSAAALVAPLALVYRDVADLPTYGGILAIVSAVVFVLVILRLIGLARGQAVDARREQALRGFSEYLVGAADASDVWNAGVDAVLAIGAAGVIGCMVTHSEAQKEKILAASWSEIVGAVVNVTTLDAQSDRRIVCLAGGDAVGATPTATLWTQLKLPEHEASRERILLAHDRPLPVDLWAILDGIAAQLFLALERVTLARVVNEARDERRFQAMVHYSSDLITLLGTDLHVTYQSPAVRAVLGRSPEELLGKSLTELVHPGDASTAELQLAKVLSGGLGSTSDFECRMAHADGHWRIVNVVITNLFDEPDIAAIVLNCRDVTERHALEEELNHQAFHDTLTGLANRSLFLDRLTHAMDRGDRGANPVAVLFLDLDDFKAVNDGFGHQAGDQLLVAVGERIRSATRPSDTVARFGGDEFAVLVETGTMPEAAQVVARRITEALTPTFRVLTNDVTMRASIGIAVVEWPNEAPDDLLRDADLAMYVAKRNGKGRIEMYRPDMHANAVRRFETEVGIREGLDANQFEVFYQPIVNAHTGQLIAAEALLRWNHPTRGLLAPIEFIPVAEATGLIVPLGRQVLSAATRQTQEWRQSGMVDEDFYVSVNLSAHQLQEPNLVDSVARALNESGLPPEGLVLEVTESSLIENFGDTIPRLHALRSLGVRLAVDDFGTGYSSLSYLADLPINFVKIDKSFIDRIAAGAEGSALVRGVIDLSKALGFTCIAEGVEREVQRSILDELGCNAIQGYLFARPASGPDITQDFTRLRLGRIVPALSTIST